MAGTRHFGNLGRNSLRGPSFKEFNFSVYKNTALTERVNLQIRAEFFNLLNHPNFSNPELPNFIADVGSPDHLHRAAYRLLSDHRHGRYWHRQSVPGWRRAAWHAAGGEDYVLVVSRECGADKSVSSHTQTSSELNLLRDFLGILSR